ncbi:hypothetical protein [Rhizobium terrae]|uniref:hypothetical protein n=1 Tax=Rhizobium terrae TaxID=2171756 RepID=UPI000E3ED249|nr:hypothetical protein [Rhizobium terrae]
MADRHLLVDHLVLSGIPAHRRAAVVQAIERAMRAALLDDAVAALPPAALEARIGAVARSALGLALASGSARSALPIPVMKRRGVR